MGFKEKLTNMFTYDPDAKDEDGAAEYAPEETAKPISKYEKAARTPVRNVNANIIICEPRTFDEASDIAKKLKESNAVMVNLRKLSREYKQRMIDFLQGVTYGLNGTTKHVDVESILCTPANVGVDGDITSDSEE